MSSENKVIKKTIEYFTTHDVLLQSELESFLKFVDLFSVWNSEADQQIVWQILSKSSSVSSVDKESVLEGIKQFIDNDTNEEDTAKEEIAPNNPTIDINAEIYLFDANKAIQIKKVFMLLDIENKDTINYEEVLSVLNDYPFLTISFIDVENALKLCNNEHLITSSEYTINKEMLTQVMKALDAKIDDDNGNHTKVQLVIDLLTAHMNKKTDDAEINKCIDVLKSVKKSHINSNNHNSISTMISTSIKSSSLYIIDKVESFAVMSDKKFPFLSFEEYQQNNKTANNISMGKNLKRINTSANHLTTLNSQSLIAISTQNKPRNSQGVTSLSTLHMNNLANEVNNTTSINNTEKYEDISNSRCDLFSIQDNQNEKFLFETTALLDSSVKDGRISSGISENDNEQKTKPPLDISNSFHSKSSFMSTMQNKKTNSIKEVDNEDELKHEENNKRQSMNSIPCMNGRNSVNIINNNMITNTDCNNIISTSNVNNNIGNYIQSSSYKNNIIISLGGEGWTSMKVKSPSPSVNNIFYSGNRATNSITNNSRSTMSLSKLKNTEITSILQNDALGTQTTGYDFLSLKDIHAVSQLLDKNKEISPPFDYFSNYVYVYSNKENKKLILLITSANIYLLDENNYTQLKKYSLKHLTKITSSTKMFNFLVFHFDDTYDDDLAIEILRRIELLFYFKSLYKFKGYTTLQIKFSNKIKMKKNGHSVTYNLAKHSLTTPNYENAIKIGYLLLYKEGFFRNSFKEKFIVLTNIGLMFFDKPNDTPFSLIPIIGSEIKTIDYNRFNLYAFSIKTPKGEMYIFATKSESECTSWNEEFKQIRFVYKQKMKNVDTNNK